MLGVRVDATSAEAAAARIAAWADGGEARYVCVAAVNNIMEAYDDPSFAEVMNAADLVTPDGMPLAWALRLLGVRGAPRVPGAELTPVIIRAASARNIPIGFYGGTPEVLRDLTTRIRVRDPRIQIAYEYSPPFRALSPEEEEAIAGDITASGTRILFVGLGCPKQERWMAAARVRVPCVTVGIGAAFDFLAGHKRRAPLPLQRLGLEWAYRLASEPRRLWRRYARHNPRFIALFTRQLIGSRQAQRT